MTAFGWGMNGMEDKLERIAKSITGQFDEITYVEIGVAEGVTLSAIAQLLKGNCKRWRAIGVELANGYSFNQQRTEEIMARRYLDLEFVSPNGNVQRPRWNQVTVYFKDSQSFLTELWQEPIHFALIDGCHGKPCVILDFIALEAWMVDGGIILMHDIGEDQIGLHQPHCTGGINVRGACYDLGLLANKRPGWKFTEEIKADKSNGGWDMGVFEKCQ